MNIIMPVELKDYVYIIFLIVIMVIGICTYVNARKSILQPIRTEIIKNQIKMFVELSDFIDQNKHYSGGNIALINIIFYLSMADSELKRTFNNNSDIKKMLDTKIGSLPCEIDEILPNRTELPNGIVVTPILQFYKDNRIAVNELYFDNEYSNIEKTIVKYKENPFVPKSIIEKLEKIENRLQDNFKSILSREIENQVNQQLTIIKTLKTEKEKLIMASVMSVKAHNEYNHKKNDVYKIFKEIQKETRKILKIDNIIVR